MDELGNFSSRLAFVVSKGVVGRNAHMWSFVNHEKKFVIFGAWTDLYDKEKHQILADDWRTLNNRAQGGYTHSLRHIELIVEENYKLFIFYQSSFPRTDETKPAEFKSFKSKLHARELLIEDGKYFAIELSNSKDLVSGATEVTSNHQDFWEGNKTSKLSTKYERNPEARAACLAKKGYTCEVCEFDFHKTYGDIGKNYIHVHHTVKVADRQGPYKVNPIKDLVPLCPNCHAMVHKNNPPYSTDELKEIIKEALTP